MSDEAVNSTPTPAKKGKSGRPLKKIVVEEVAEDDVSVSETEDADAEIITVPEPLEIKKKRKMSEKQLANLAAARAKRLKELKSYNSHQKAKAEKDSEAFFNEKLNELSEKRLEIERAKWELENESKKKATKPKKTVAKTPQKAKKEKPVQEKVAKPSRARKTPEINNDYQYAYDQNDPFDGIC